MEIPVVLFIVMCFAVIVALTLDAAGMINVPPRGRTVLTLAFLGCVIAAVVMLLVALSGVFGS